MKKFCIYHNRDLDGFSSGAIVKKKFPDCKLIGFDYGMPLETILKEINMGDMVIMVDISLPMEDMKHIADICMGNFIWIDHHRSAISEFLDSDFLRSPATKKTLHENFAVYETPHLRAILQDGIAACEIAWHYFFKGQRVPEAISLLGEYDTWRKEDNARWSEKIIPFQFAFRAICKSPETFPEWAFGDDVNVSLTIRTGMAILKYIHTTNEINCQKNSFVIDFKGKKAICLNGGGFNSDVFKSVYDEDKHDLMMPFQFNGKFWTVSLYTTKDEIDCSVLAKSMGGGGHKKAAGFQVEDIAFITNQNQIL